MAQAGMNPPPPRPAVARPPLSPPSPPLEPQQPPRKKRSPAPPPYPPGTILQPTPPPKRGGQSSGRKNLPPEPPPYTPGTVLPPSPPSPPPKRSGKRDVPPYPPPLDPSVCVTTKYNICKVRTKGSSQFSIAAEGSVRLKEATSKGSVYQITILRNRTACTNGLEGSCLKPLWTFMMAVQPECKQAMKITSMTNPLSKTVRRYAWGIGWTLRGDVLPLPANCAVCTGRP